MKFFGWVLFRQYVYIHWLCVYFSFERDQLSNQYNWTDRYKLHFMFTNIRSELFDCHFEIELYSSLLLTDLTWFSMYSIGILPCWSIRSDGRITWWTSKQDHWMVAVIHSWLYCQKRFQEITRPEVSKLAALDKNMKMLTLNR